MIHKIKTSSIIIFIYYCTFIVLIMLNIIILSKLPLYSLHPHLRYVHTKIDHSHRIKSPIDKIIPYGYNKEEAAKRFLKIDEDSFFSTTHDNSIFSLLDTENVESINNRLMIKRENPLKAVYLPFFYFTANIEPVQYDASYGIDRTVTRYDKEGKPHFHIVTDWYNISGIIGNKDIKFNAANTKSRIYAGYKYMRDDVEYILNKCKLSSEMSSYDKKYISNTTHVDVFKMRRALAKKKAVKRIKNKLNRMIERDIESKVHCDHIIIDNIRNFKFIHLHMNTCYFPSYVLQYHNTPPRILSAIRDEEYHSGKVQLSTQRVIMSSVLPSVALAVAMPYSVPIRIAATAVCMAGAALYSKYARSIEYHSDIRYMENKEINNNLYSETLIDRKRRIESEQFVIEEEVRMYSDPVYAQILDIPDNLKLNKDIIESAFRKQIKIYHPDVYKSNIEAIKIIEARNELLKELKIAEQ